MWRLRGCRNDFALSTLAFEQLLQLGPKRRRQVGSVKGVGDVGRQKADLASAVVNRAIEAHGEERLAFGKLDHGIGDLDLAAGAALATLEDGEYLRLQDIASGDVQIGRRGAARWLLDHAGDARDLRSPILDADDAIEVRLLLGHRRDGDVISTALPISL